MKNTIILIPLLAAAAAITALILRRAKKEHEFPAEEDHPFYNDKIGLILHDISSSDRYYTVTIRMQDNIIIGRNKRFRDSEDMYLELPDATISKKHCRLYLDSKSNLIIEDIGSTNGTILNGIKLEEPAIIHNGDSLKLGRILLSISIK